jgi:hypothetical protein
LNQDGIKRHVPVIKASKEGQPEDQEDDGLKERINAFFRKKDVHTLIELSDYFDMGVSKIKKVIEDLIHQGHNYKIENDYVICSKLLSSHRKTKLEVKKPASGFYKFGATGDQHLGSRYERLDALNKLYDIYVEEGITTVYNTGNWIDGEARFNKHDLLVTEWTADRLLHQKLSEARRHHHLPDHR